MLRLTAGHAQRRNVDQHEVVVRAAGDNASALLTERGRQHLGVDHCLALIVAELVCVGELEGRGLGGDDVNQRAALRTREDALVNGLAQVLAADCLLYTSPSPRD